MVCAGVRLQKGVARGRRADHLASGAHENPVCAMGRRVGLGLGHLAATVFWCDGQQEFPVMSKQQLAENIVRLIAKHNNK